MITFTNISNIKISYSADDWELYDIDGRDRAADELNAGVAALMSNWPSKADVKWKEIETLLFNYVDYGAADSEGYQMVDYIFSKVYGEY
jgi:hypothetical protein